MSRLRERPGLLPLITAVIGVLLAAWQPSLPYQPTGDALYDRFARLTLKLLTQCDYHAAVPDEYRGEVYYNAQYATPLVTLDYSEIEAWEPEFGGDPRYWQLRVVCGVDDVIGPVQQDKHDLHSHLRASIERGIADPASFTLLPWRIILDEDEALALRFYTQAVTADNDNAYWHYRQAAELMNLGETDAAWQAVQRGNAAAHNRMVYPFPISTLHDPRYDSAAADNEVVRGIVFQLECQRIENFIRWKEEYKNANCCLALGYPLEFGDAWMTMARRFGQAEGASVWYPYVGAVLAGTVSGYVTQECIDVGPKYQAEAAAVYKLAQRMNVQTAFKPDLLWINPAPCMHATPHQTMMTFLRSESRVQKSLGQANPFSGSTGGYRSLVTLPNRSRKDWVNAARIQRAQMRRAHKAARRLRIIPEHAFTKWAGQGGG